MRRRQQRSSRQPGNRRGQSLRWPVGSGRRSLSVRLRKLVIVASAVAAAATLAVLATVGVVQSAYPFPYSRLQEWPTSPRVTDSSDSTLLEVVGTDDQWRFPVPLDEVSPWLIQATLASEDERFDSHRGVDLTAIGRAILQNIRAGEVHSGASTLTMQLCRMVDDRPRTFATKIIEASRALAVEREWPKSKILEEYLNLAPYGGNLRGAEAAARQYFNKSARDLSLGEAALLAGLPQSPSRYRPDRFPDIAEQRRVYVLQRMLTLRQIDEAQFAAALQEPVIDRWTSPQSQRRLSTAPHAAWLALQQRPTGGRTTIDVSLQTDVERIVDSHVRDLPPGTDAAVVVIDVSSAAIVTLVGSADVSDEVDGQVNGALARRSPGSALKPFLYAAAFETGRLSAESRIPDRPIQRAGWSPDNFDREFRGEMSVAEALRQSRNVPAILVQEAVGSSRCLGVLAACGVDLPADAHRRSGLTLAVGGVETTLLDLTNAWATLARDGRFARPRLFVDEPLAHLEPALTSGTARLVSDILSTRYRTPAGCESLPSNALPWFAWKTGTSSGRRDAWAVGQNGRFAVGIWVGRFSGAGHASFTGRDAAEPILSAVFQLPAIENRTPPPVPSELPVSQPFVWSDQSAPGDAEPRIVSPADQSRFVASISASVQPDDAEPPGHSTTTPPRTAIIPVTASHSDHLTWFLNGRVVPLPDDRRLRLPRGAYELRCIATSGTTSRVRFAVE